jgi:hypothetical protein
MIQHPINCLRQQGDIRLVDCWEHANPQLVSAKFPIRFHIENAIGA